MKKSIMIIILLSVVNLYSEPEDYRTQKSFGPYYYQKITRPSWTRPGDRAGFEYVAERNLDKPFYVSSVSGTIINNPLIHWYNRTSQGDLEGRAVEVPLEEALVLGGAYLAGRWAWNRLMTSKFKTVENKINNITKLNNELITKISDAQNDAKATADDKTVLAIYEKVASECQKIYSIMKQEIESHRKDK